MDLRLFFSVIGRFKILVGAFFLVGCILAVLSVATVDPSHLSIKWRKAEQWQATGRLLLTAPPITEAEAAAPVKPGEQTPYDVRNSVVATLPTTAALYANLVASDGVLAIVRKRGPLDGVVIGRPVKIDPFGGGGYLPMISVQSLSDTPAHAIDLGDRTITALTTYVRSLQVKSGTPTDTMVGLRRLNRPGQLTLVQGHNKTLPIAVLVAFLAVGIALAFLLENLKPRVRLLAAGDHGRPDTQAATDVRSRAVS